MYVIIINYFSYAYLIVILNSYVDPILYIYI